jgi:hypothetical protein
MFDTTGMSILQDAQHAYLRWMGFNKCLKPVGIDASFSERFGITKYLLACYQKIRTAEDVCRGLAIDFKQIGYEITQESWLLVLDEIERNHELCAEMVVHVAKRARWEFFHKLLSHRATEKMDMNDCDLQGTTHDTLVIKRSVT